MPANNFDIKVESITINNLRVILCFLILLIHMPLLIHGQQVNVADDKYIYYLFIFFKRGVCSVAVPTFFFISGFLFFYKVDFYNKSDYLKKIKRRFVTLVIPYIIWNILYICYSYFSEPETALTRFDEMGYGKMFWNCDRFGEDCSDSYNILGYCLHNSAPIDGPLWFIRDLIIACIFTPLIYILIKKFGWFVISIIGLMMILNIWIPIEGFSSTCFFFFMFGACFSINRISFVSVFRKYMPIGIVLSILLLYFIVVLYGKHWLIYNIIFNSFNIIGCVTAVALVSYIPQIDSIVWNNIKNSSFFIFASHFAIVQLVSTYLFKYIPDTYSVIIYFTTPFIVLIIIESTFILFKKIPFFTFLLNGGR